MTSKHRAANHVAVLACEGLLARVDSFMPNEITLPCEGLRVLYVGYDIPMSSKPCRSAGMRRASRLCGFSRAVRDCSDLQSTAMAKLRISMKGSDTNKEAVLPLLQWQTLSQTEH